MTTAPVEIAITLEVAAWQSALPDVAELAERAAHATLTAAGSALPAGVPAELGIVLADDALVRRLNRDYRGKDKPTNVLSFALSEDAGETPATPAAAQHLLGDVILAYETVCAEARAQGKPLAHHVIHLVVHGTLHLLGHDHQTDAEADRMERLEAHILAGFGIPDPYADPPSPSATPSRRR